jgi:hypothetical protein
MTTSTYRLTLENDGLLYRSRSNFHQVVNISNRLYQLHHEVDALTVAERLQVVTEVITKWEDDEVDKMIDNG